MSGTTNIHTRSTKCQYRPVISRSSAWKRPLLYRMPTTRSTTTPMVTWVRCNPVIVKKDAPNRSLPHGLWNMPTPSWMRPIHSRKCRSAKIMPPTAVITVQRKAPLRLPSLASRTPRNMVRLLLIRMNVMTMAFTIVGKNLNGVGQLMEPLRRNPYATRHAAKVAASAMMNSHIASFFVGRAKGDDLGCPIVWSFIVRSAWLNVVPPGAALHPHPQQQQKIDPEYRHEVPVVRNCAQST